jgi:hypothetical protein
VPTIGLPQSSFDTLQTLLQRGIELSMQTRSATTSETSIAYLYAIEVIFGQLGDKCHFVESGTDRSKLSGDLNQTSTWSIASPYLATDTGIPALGIPAQPGTSDTTAGKHFHDFLFGYKFQGGGALTDDVAMRTSSFDHRMSLLER